MGTSRARALARPRLRLLVALAAVILLLGGGWLWLRDSSLVAVRRVSVIGAAGPEAGRIRQALIAAARTMTTLDVHQGDLRNAVQPYPVVKHLEVSTQFPHGMTIHVIEQIPVAAMSVDGHTTAVASDGTLLPGVAVPPQLPLIPLPLAPVGTRLTGSQATGAVAVLAAAPYQVLSRISQVSTVRGHGLVAQLRNGPSLVFGDTAQLDRKWSAALAVLADSGSADASYIDVSVPGRPAAGAGSLPSSSTHAASPATSGTAASASAGAPSAGPTSTSGTTPTAASTSPGTSTAATGSTASG
jgi:cell division protein FtsQ